MPKAGVIYIWTVRGSGQFPIDMLRYDQAWPFSEIHAGIIEGTFRRGSGNEPATVNLYSLKPHPTSERWKSFGWETVFSAGEVR